MAPPQRNPHGGPGQEPPGADGFSGFLSVAGSISQVEKGRNPGEYRKVKRSRKVGPLFRCLQQVGRAGEGGPRGGGQIRSGCRVAGETPPSAP